MNLMTRLYLLQHLVRWRLTWDQRNTRYGHPVEGNPKFMSAREAVNLIKDSSVIATSGIAGNQRSSIMYWAIREEFMESGRPKNLTVICTGGQGGRGKVPGTLEEIALPGLCTRFIGGHLETFKAFLKLADEKRIDLHCMPQGILALLFAEQGEGKDFLLSCVGEGTFVDPRTGRGSRLTGEEQFVSVEEGKLRYHIPQIDVAIFNAPAADREGNLYVKDCALIGESHEIAHAARKNKGVVIANVGLLVEPGYDEVFLPASMVDAIVLYPGTEQTGSVPHRKPWRFFTPQSDLPAQEGIERARFINRVIGITPRRNEMSEIMARLAAKLFVQNVQKGAFVNIGVGLPEEVCRLICESGLLEEITFFTEGGTIGGIPAPGIFFGASVCPKEIVSSAQVFKRFEGNVKMALFGVLQVDSEGNVNVSKRGDRMLDYVGSGGFIDLSTMAENVIFIGSWMAHGRMKREGDRIKIVERGRPKFIDRVDEVTFNGPNALKHGKKVFYVTEVGAFRLTSRGMELICVMPGIDLQRDILDFTPMKVVLPDSGEVPLVDASVVLGQEFSLHIG